MGCAASVGDRYAAPIEPTPPPSRQSQKSSESRPAPPQIEPEPEPEPEPELEPEPDVERRCGWLEEEVVISREKREWQKRWCVVRGAALWIYSTQKECTKRKPPLYLVPSEDFVLAEPKSKLKELVDSEGRRSVFVIKRAKGVPDLSDPFADLSGDVKSPKSPKSPKKGNGKTRVIPSKLVLDPGPEEEAVPLADDTEMQVAVRTLWFRALRESGFGLFKKGEKKLARSARATHSDCLTTIVHTRT